MILPHSAVEPSPTHRDQWLAGRHDGIAVIEGLEEPRGALRTFLVRRSAYGGLHDKQPRLHTEVCRSGRQGSGLRLGASSVTLGGLLKHLAWVEELDFQTRLAGRQSMAPFDQVDPDKGAPIKSPHWEEPTNDS